MLKYLVLVGFFLGLFSIVPANAQSSMSDTIMGLPPIVRLEHNLFQVGDVYMSREGYKSFLATNCRPAYRRFRSGQKLSTIGFSLLGGAAGMGGISALLLLGNQREVMPVMLLGIMTLGSTIALTTASVPLITIGSILKPKALRYYNRNCANQGQVNISLVNNGIGAVVTF